MKKIVIVFCMAIGYILEFFLVRIGQEKLIRMSHGEAWRVIIAAIVISIMVEVVGVAIPVLGVVITKNNPRRFIGLFVMVALIVVVVSVTI